MSVTFEVEAYLVAGWIVGVVEAKERWPLAMSSHVAREASCKAVTTPALLGRRVNGCAAGNQGGSAGVVSQRRSWNLCS